MPSVFLTLVENRRILPSLPSPALGWRRGVTCGGVVRLVNEMMIDQYREAVDQHRQRVYSFAHYSLRGAADAEDVTQDVFIKLWQHWRRIDHERLSAWLMRVAHNAVIDHVRRQKRQGEVLDSFQDVDAVPGQPGQTNGGINRLDRPGLQHSLQRAVRELRDPFRSIIIMRDIQGQSYADIEKSLELSASQVKVYLHRARRKLREDPELRQWFTNMKDA